MAADHPTDTAPGQAIPAFQRYIGIDYSGAETAGSELSGLRVYAASRQAPPEEILPPGRYWSRRAIAEWLVTVLSEGKPALIGIDHGFSFPLAYFEKYRLPHDWPKFLDDFEKHWPTGEYIYVDFVREGVCGNGAARTGLRTWRRITEVRSRKAKSVFHFDVPGSVAKSTHSGLPWLNYIRRHDSGSVHFWPFDGWQIPPGRSVIAEVYPSLWNKSLPSQGRNPHQQDAYCVAAWLRDADMRGSLPAFLHPRLNEQERKIAAIEGWILGIL